MTLHIKANTIALFMAKRGVRRAVQRLLRPFGVQLTRLDSERSERARTRYAIDQSKARTVLDIGANSGQWALQLRASGYAGQIISFEPLSEAHGALQRNASGQPGWSVAARCALGSSSRQTVIHTAANSWSSSLLPMLKAHEDAAPNSVTTGQEAVDIVRIDEHPMVLSSSGPLFAKIDTQGYELEVLQGAERVWSRLAGLILEASLVPLYEGQPLLAEVVSFLDARGFRIVDLFPEFQHPESGQLLQVNLVALVK